MIDEQQVGSLPGAMAVGSDGELGTVGEVFVDDRTGRAEWATVRTAHASSREAFVPLVDAVVDAGRLLLPYDGRTVRSAPHHDVQVEGHLSPGAEADLLRHYGLDANQAVAETVGTVDGPDADRHRPS